MRGISWLLLMVSLIVSTPRLARANCTDSDGYAGCDFVGPTVALTMGGIIEASILIGGIVTMAGGANDLLHERATRKWRVANYVFGTLNLAAGIVWGGFAAANISPQLTGSFALPHLAVGAANLGVGIVSQTRADGSRYTGVNLAWRF
jgi:hypothetical protein